MAEVTMIEMNSVPVPAPEAVGRVINGEAVIVLPQQGTVKVLNEVGARIWTLADGSRTVGEIAAVICAEYQVTTEEAREDACRFIETLAGRGVLAILQPPVGKD
jgi:hypothetical protein